MNSIDQNKKFEFLRNTSQVFHTSTAPSPVTINTNTLDCWLYH